MGASSDLYLPAICLASTEFLPFDVHTIAVASASPDPAASRKSRTRDLDFVISRMYIACVIPAVETSGLPSDCSPGTSAQRFPLSIQISKPS